MKIRTCISKVTLDTPTFHHVSFEPSLVNFMYGRNGSGKSTIGRAMQEKQGLVWEPRFAADMPVLLYNEDFIQRNVRSYAGMDGVFTISEANAEIQMKIEGKQAELVERQKEYAAVSSELAEHLVEGEQGREAYEREVWRSVSEYRKEYPETIPAALQKSVTKFVRRLEEIHPQERRKEELDSTYQTAFGKERVSYTRYTPLPMMLPPEIDLMDIPIVSSSETPLAAFCRALSNLDWLRQGHDSYQHQAGQKCPYCRQTLPEDFEAQLADCFDETYKHDLEKLQQQTKAYMEYLTDISAILKTNMGNPYPGSHANQYRRQATTILEKIAGIRRSIEDKLRNPSGEYVIVSIQPLLVELQGVEESINTRIDHFMKLMADVPGLQEACSKDVWSHMAAVCKDLMLAQRAKEEEQEKTKKRLTSRQKILESAISELKQSITELTRSTVNTTEAMEEINKALIANGFQGFYLREKPGERNLYELVRRDANGITTASGLSEGERHFIAFLYFYQQVMGKENADGEMEDRIVVIDDPVCSMDSGALCVVAAMVRDIIGVCMQNAKDQINGAAHHVQQFFCLTHNPVFFRQISFECISDYDRCSFFEIRKDGNNCSSVKECYEEFHEMGCTRVNLSPVMNHYEDLWRTYRTAKEPMVLLFAARQILEIYFLQMVGCNGHDLRANLLGNHQQEFIHTDPDGSTNRTDYTIASAMVELMNTGRGNFMDGLYFDATAYDQEQLRYVFHRIFTVLDSEQHYHMMMRTQRTA